MIDQEGYDLYYEMMALIRHDENSISEEVEAAMAAFDKHMNALNCTTGMLYGKHGEVLMKC